jgi:NAD(P)-dependent dehydrogenase (short-subunit alcohol dehydrogenase family)
MPALDGRAVLVTGASTGIGRCCTLHLARRGATVIAGVRRREDGDAVAAEGPAGRVRPVRLDVTDPEAACAAVAGVDALHGLVNNAGIAVTGPLEFMPLEELRRQFEVNVIGQLAVTQACLEALRRAQGRIVNVSSIGGRVAGPLYGPYSASKFALEALSDALRRELRGSGVRVSVVEPGGIATPIWERGLAAADALYAAMPPVAHERYDALVASVRADAGRTAAEGLPPQAVADVVEHALTAVRPRTRYLVGREAKIGANLARVLPDRAVDALVARSLRS